MTEEVKKAFDFASDLCKQLITLSTGVVALTITFATDILTAVPASAKYVLMGSWFVYLGSVVCGVWMLMALTGSLDPLQPKIDSPTKPRVDAMPSINGWNIRLPATLQILLFLSATLLVIVFGITSAP